MKIVETKDKGFYRKEDQYGVAITMTQPLILKVHNSYLRKSDFDFMVFIYNSKKLEYSSKLSTHFSLPYVFKVKLNLNSETVKSLLK